MDDVAGRPNPEPPRLGVVLSFQARPDLGEPHHWAYGDGLAFAAEADRLGVDDVWVTEHHVEDDGYCPSPIAACAAVAAVTERAQIGQSIAIAPLQGHPLRWRRTCRWWTTCQGGGSRSGWARATGERSSRPSGFPMAEGRWRSTRRSMCWNEPGRAKSSTTTAASTRCTVAGSAHRRCNPAAHRCGSGRPPLAPGRGWWPGVPAWSCPRWWSGSTARQFESFDRAVAADGCDPLPHAIVREIVVGDGVTDALAAVRPHLDYVYGVQYAPERTGMTFVDRVTGQRRALTVDDPYYLSEEFVRDRWCFGSPEECADTIVGWVRRTPIDRLLCQPKMPGRSLAEAVVNLERIVTEVMPLVRRRLAGPPP